MDYQISDLFLDAFGLRLNNEETEIKPNPQSYLGTPILNPITFLAKKYESFENIGIRKFGAYKETKDFKPQTVTHHYDNFTLPSSSIASFSRKKIISYTKMPNATGTVKQIFGFEDYRITIKGFCLPDPLHPQGFTTPLQQEKELIKWDNVLSSIDVKATEFNGARDIHSIKIQSIDFPTLRGKPKIKPFVIHALSAPAAEEEEGAFFEVTPPQNQL